MGLGVLLLAITVALSWQIAAAEGEHALAVAAAEQAEADPTVQRHLLGEARLRRTGLFAWRQRRLGLGLAGLVLLIGGFGASGLRALHDKMVWAEIERSRRPPS